MKYKDLIRFEAMALMLMLLVSCHRDHRRSTSNMSDAILVTDTVNIGKDLGDVSDSKMVLDSVCYYWPGEAVPYQYSVIELISEADQVLCGYLWGTTDEFDYAREGYLPGYMVVPMQDIKQKGDTLNFEIDTDGHKFYSAPVSIYIHDPEKEHCDSLHQWYVPSDNFWDTVKFTAVFNKKELSIIAKSKYWYWDDKPHVFRVYDRDSLAKILPPIPEDIEKINHGDGWFPVLNDTVLPEEITEEIPFDS